MEIISRLVKILIFLTALGLITGCGKGFQVAEKNSIGSEGGPDLFCQSGAISVRKAKAENPFSGKKVHVQSRGNFAQAKTAALNPSLMDRLDILVDLSCAKENSGMQTFLGATFNLKKPIGVSKAWTFSMAWPQGLSVEQIEKATSNNPCIKGVTQSARVKATQVQAALTNDQFASRQEHLEALSYWELEEYLLLSQLVTEPVRVAVIDTGIDYTHPDLQCNMWQGIGADIVNSPLGDNDPMDDNIGVGHGTHVAGIIGACGDNRIGVTGVMSGKVELMAVKSLGGDGGGSIEDVTNGIRFAVGNGADIINLSLEAQGIFPAMTAAIVDAVNAGVVVVVAAGNDGNLINSQNIVSPASDSNIPGVITVGSLDAISLNLSSFSNFSSEIVEIAATGSHDTTVRQGILSTALGGGYERIAGTSQAAPMVAGAAGIIIGVLKSKGVAYTPADIETYILSRGTSLNAGLNGAVKNSAQLNFANLKTNLEDEFGGEFSGTQCP